MFEKLIPWKKRNSDTNNNLPIRHDDDPVAALRRDFDNLVARFFDDGLDGRFDNGFLRSGVDFDEDDKCYTMTAELPGFEPNDFDVKVSGNVLTVRAERREQSKTKHGRTHSYGSYYESFQLPPNVKPDEIDAAYHSGVLEVRVPKDERTPTKRIAVKAA